MKRLATIAALSAGLLAGPAFAANNGGLLTNNGKTGVNNAVDGRIQLAGHRYGDRDHRYRRRHERRGHVRNRLHPIREVYVARTASNVRAGPSTRFRVIDKLYRHERVRVIGKVKGRRWYLVRSGGRRGFVYAPLLRKPYGHYGRRDHRRHGYGWGGWWRRHFDDDHDGGRRWRH